MSQNVLLAVLKFNQNLLRNSRYPLYSSIIRDLYNWSQKWLFIPLSTSYVLLTF